MLLLNSSSISRHLDVFATTITRTTVAMNETAQGATPSNKIVAFNACFLSLAALIVIVNMIILIVYYHTPTLHSNNNYLLISLAFTDLVAGGLNIPVLGVSALIVTTENTWRQVALPFIGNVLSDFTIIVNELNLFLIFLNRYLIICFPLKSRKMITKRRIRLLIAVVWSVSALVALLPLAWCYKVVFGRPYTEEYKRKMHTSISHHSISVSVCCFILPSIAMLFFLVCMIYSINKHKKKRRRRMSKNAGGASACGGATEAQQTGGAVARSSRRQRLSKKKFNLYVKAFCMLLAMYISMLVAWSPLMVVRLCLDLRVNIKIESGIFHAFMILRFITAFINPFIYSFIKQEFRVSLLKKIRCW
eukprot:gene18989-20900_t